MNSMGPSHGFVKRLRKPPRFFEVVARPLDAVRKLVEADPARERELARHFRCKQPAAAPAWIPSDLDADVLSGRILLWIACGGVAIESDAATAPIRSEIGKVCIITACGEHGIKRWSPASWAQRGRPAAPFVA